jgi:D-alanyl-D-alanine carboxypeptidase
MSYPDGKEKVVCYSYEPWHYRYVGRELAEKIHDSGLTIREYLWANYTQVDPACVALPAPKLVTPGTPRSCAFPEASPSVIPSFLPGGTVGPGDGSPLPVGSAAAPSPKSTPQPAPASALEQAIPIGVSLVVAVVAMLGFVLWRSSRRPR